MQRQEEQQGGRRSTAAVRSLAVVRSTAGRAARLQHNRSSGNCNPCVNTPRPHTPTCRLGRDPAGSKPSLSEPCSPSSPDPSWSSSSSELACRVSSTQGHAAAMQRNRRTVSAPGVVASGGVRQQPACSSQAAGRKGAVTTRGVHTRHPQTRPHPKAGNHHHDTTPKPANTMLLLPACCVPACCVKWSQARLVRHPPQAPSLPADCHQPQHPPPPAGCLHPPSPHPPPPHSLPLLLLHHARPAAAAAAGALGSSEVVSAGAVPQQKTPYSPRHLLSQPTETHQGPQPLLLLLPPLHRCHLDTPLRHPQRQQRRCLAAPAPAAGGRGRGCCGPGSGLLLLLLGAHLDDGGNNRQSTGVT